MGIASSTAKILSPTAVALGASVQSEEAEGAYIPLKAFYETGSDAAKALYKKAKAAIDAGADEDKLYQDFLVFKSEDGVYKVDVPELKARDLEAQEALFKFGSEFKAVHAASKEGHGVVGTMADFLPKTSPVFENFPELQNSKVIVRTRRSDEDPLTLGYYQPATKEMHIFVPKKGDPNAPVDNKELNEAAYTAFGTLVHEFQHHIQDVKGAFSDGMSTGGANANKKNLRERKDKYIDQELEYQRRKAKGMGGGFGTKQEREEALARIKELENEKAGIQDIWDDAYGPTHAIYIRDLGEAEARSSGVKALLTADERKNIGVFYPKDQSFDGVGRPAPSTLKGLEKGLASGEMTKIDPNSILLRTYDDKKILYKNKKDGNTYETAELVNVNSEVAKKGLGAKDLPSSAFAGALGLDMARKEIFGEADQSTKDAINSAIFGTTAGKLYSALRNEAPADTTYAESDLVTESPVVGDVLFAADMLQEVVESNKMEEGEPQPEAVDEFTGVEFAQGGLMEQHMQMEADRLAGKQEPEQKKEPRYEDFGLTSTDMIAPALTGTTEDVVDAAHISRTFSAENKFEDSDRTEDTMRHILLGGLVFGDMENDSLIEKGQRWVADKLIDAREYKEKLQNDNPENDIDLNNNEYGRQLRQLFPDREEFIEAVKTLTAGMYKGEEVPDIGGVKPQLSYGNAGPAQPETNQGLMSDE